jgi:hypothetical protein
MKKGINKFWTVIIALTLIGGLASAITIDPDVVLYPNNCGYRYFEAYTVTDLNLSIDSIRLNNVIYGCGVSTGTVENLIVNINKTDVNITQKPSINQQITNYFNNLTVSKTFYAHQNGTYKGSFNTNTTGYGYYYAPYRSAWQQWDFNTVAYGLPTTTTSTSTIPTYTLPTVTTTIAPFEGNYEIPQSYYLRQIADTLQNIFIQNTQEDGLCQLIVDNDTFFGSPEIIKTTHDSEYTYTEFLNTGLYYWKVRCYYYGRWSMWSNSKEITHTDIGKNMYFDWTVKK